MNTTSIRTFLLPCIATTFLLLSLCTHAESPTPFTGTSVGTPRQQEWLATKDQGRRVLSETLGEEGSARWAKEKGLMPVLDQTQKQYRHGFDQVWRKPNGDIMVIESKGGSSPL